MKILLAIVLLLAFGSGAAQFKPRIPYERPYIPKYPSASVQSNSYQLKLPKREVRNNTGGLHWVQVRTQTNAEFYTISASKTSRTTVPRYPVYTDNRNTLYVRRINSPSRGYVIDYD